MVGKKMKAINTEDRSRGKAKVMSVLIRALDNVLRFMLGMSVKTDSTR